MTFLEFHVMFQESWEYWKEPQRKPQNCCLGLRDSSEAKIACCFSKRPALRPQNPYYLAHNHVPGTLTPSPEFSGHCIQLVHIQIPTNKKLFSFFLNVFNGCSACMCVTSVSGAFRRQKRLSDALGLDLQMAVIYQDAGNQTWVLWKSSQCS